MKVSVIIPAYDSGWCIHRCLTSVSAQAGDIEILVGVDNCEKTLKQLNRIDIDFRCFWFPKHAGCYKIRNTLSKEASGDVLMFFDADDWMLQDYVEVMLDHLDESCYVRSLQQWIRGGKYVDAFGKHKFHQSVMQIAVHKKNYMSVRGCEPWEINADSELIQRLRQFGLEEVNIRKPIMIRQKHEKSLTCDPNTGYKSERRLALKKIVKDRAKNPVILKKMVTSEFEEVLC